MTTTETADRTDGIGIPARPRGDLLAAMMGLTTCLLPFLVPAGPGNTAPADVGIMLCIVLAVLWAVREQLPIKLPYLAGVTGLVLGGAFAAIVTDAPVGAALVLVQDAAAARLGGVAGARPAQSRDRGRGDPGLVPDGRRVLGRDVGRLPGRHQRAHRRLGEGRRPGVVHVRRPEPGRQLPGHVAVRDGGVSASTVAGRPAARLCLVVLTAIGFTGSNGAMLTLAGRSGARLHGDQYRRQGPVAGLATLAVTGVARRPDDRLRDAPGRPRADP